ncbi:MAG: FAD-dependent oxidoreductase [Ferroplasma sp.]
MEEKIITLGAGLSGIYSRLENKQSIIIDKSDHITIPTRLIYIIKGRDRSYACVKRKVDVIGKVTDIDFKNRKVVTDKDSYNYDKIIIALGSDLVSHSIVGDENMLKLQTIEDAETIRSRAQKAKIITIIGGGYLGVELAGLFPGKTINLIDANSRLLSRSNKKAALYSYNILKSLNVNVVLNEKVTEVTASSAITDKNSYKSDMTIYAGGATGNKLVSKLNIKSSNSRIIVNNYMRSSDYDDVYACGDSMSLNGKNNPMTAYIARKSGVVAMKNAMGHEVQFKSSESGNILNINDHFVLFTENSFIRGFPVGMIKKYVNNKTDKSIAAMNKN